MSLISESEALAAVLSAVSPLPAESLALTAALGRYSTRSLYATVPQPSFDNSAMDGYALRVADAAVGSVLQVTGEQPAGAVQPSLSVQPGSAVRIFTGAPLPPGTEAVIMQEDVQREGQNLRILNAVLPGEHIRRAGCDVCSGQLLFRPGAVLNPQRLGLLASQGLTQVHAHGTPRVAIISTGNELVTPGQPLLPGQLYESNGTMLEALVRQLGVTHITRLHCADDLVATTQLLADLLPQHHAILLSGGVSVGEHDYVKPALTALGVQPQFWRVKIKPGKPFLFSQHGSASIFGLPGNPVSSFVTYALFVRPALLKMLGASDTALPTTSAEVSIDIQNSGDRPHYVRGSYHAGQFHPAGLQQSHALFGLSQANALLRMEAEETLSKGSHSTINLIG